ncbi:MAG: hypothetical protein RJA98_2633 [Pseudomonadota bacterium]|jgi:predicted DNA-binding transcriptional regulator AlpA
MIVAASPITVDSATAAQMMGNLGKSTFLAYVSRGQMPRPRKIGSRSMWLVSELQEAALKLAVADDTPEQPE